MIVFVFIHSFSKGAASMSKIMKFTKIVATLGPNSRDPETVEQPLLREGADVIRLNFSHGSLEDHETAVRRVREAAQN